MVTRFEVEVELSPKDGRPTAVLWRSALLSFVRGISSTRSLSSDPPASPPQTMSPPYSGERELTTRQAALVDSAFEEGQYESGIEMLEQLCSPTEHPSR
jgi:hypothetical protein